jgi:PAS domain S-box-containing protein
MIKRDQDNERQHALLVALTRNECWHSGDEETALRTLAETVAHGLEVERVSLWHFADDRSRILCDNLFENSINRHSAGQELRARDFPAYFKALEENAVISATDARQDPRTSAFTEPYLTKHGIVSMLDAPVFVSGVLHGILCIEHTGAARQWTRGEEEFAVSVANLVSLLFAQRASARSEAEQKQTAAVVLKVAQSVSIPIGESFLEDLSLRMVEALGVTGGLILLTDSLNPTLAATQALILHGEKVRNVCYDVRGTPCQTILENGAAVFDRGIQLRFPDDPMLAEIGIEAYAGVPLQDQEGRVTGLVAVLSDHPLENVELVLSVLRIFASRITSEAERQATGARLKRVQRQQELILGAVGEGIHGIDAQGRIVFENPAAVAMLGWSLNELLGNDSHALIHHHHPDGREYAVEECPIYRTLRDGKQRQIDHEIFFRKDGSQFPVEYLCSPVREESGLISGAVVTFRDITERKEAEDERKRLITSLATRVSELREAEALLKMASRVGRMGAWSLDIPTLQLRWSEEARAIHEMDTDADLSFEDLIRFYVPESREVVRKVFARCMAEGKAFDEEWQLVTAKGRTMWVRTIGEAVWDQSGLPGRIQGAIQDVNERKEVETSLAASEERFRHLAESMPIIVWSATPEGEVDYANHVLFDYTGISRDESPVIQWQNCVHSKDLERGLLQWAESVKTGSPFAIEYRIRRGCDQTYRWFHVQAVAVRDGGGLLVKWYGTAIEIHDTKQLEQEARGLAARLSTTLASITDGFFTVDRAWRFTYINDEAERLLDRPREQLLDRQIWKEFPQAVGSRIYHEYHRAQAENTTVELEEYYPPLARWFEIRAYPSHEGLAVYFRDVTERLNTQRKLREQAALLDKAQDAILVRDLEHRVQYWNKSAERLYGWSADQAIGRPIQDLLYRDPTAFLAATEETLAQGEWLGEIEQFSRDGRALIVESRWTLVRDSSGRPESILAINTDITERKTLEAQFLRAQRLESIGTLAGGIAHDLNNILSPILMAVELLKTNEADENQLKLLNTLHASARRGADLVGQVLSFARGTEGIRTCLNLRVLAAEIQVIIHNTFPQNIHFILESDETLWNVDADATQLHQVLINLCVNARDAMPSGGRLTLNLENVVLEKADLATHPQCPPGPYLLVRVEDTGHGMPPEIQERIFDPFFTTKSIGEGTGLGLPTVATIVRSHGGFMNVSSKPGKGSAFRIYLPATVTPEPSATIAVRRDRPRGGNGELILVVDDEEAIRIVARSILERFGYRVILAKHGAEAVALYVQHREEIAVVFTDMAMPVMDGPAAIAALQAIDPKVKIIGCSGLAGNSHIAKTKKAGIRHFFPKPYTADTLLRALSETLSQQK